jgi:hypothetical protein
MAYRVFGRMRRLVDHTQPRTGVRPQGRHRPGGPTDSVRCVHRLDRRSARTSHRGCHAVSESTLTATVYPIPPLISIVRIVGSPTGIFIGRQSSHSSHALGTADLVRQTTLKAWQANRFGVFSDAQGSVRLNTATQARVGQPAPSVNRVKRSAAADHVGRPAAPATVADGHSTMSRGRRAATISASPDPRTGEMTAGAGTCTPGRPPAASTNGGPVRLLPRHHNV